MSYNWQGPMTAENALEIATMMSDLLEGRSFTYVNMHDKRDFQPVTQAGKKLNHESRCEGKAIDLHVNQDTEEVTLNVAFGSTLLSIIRSCGRPDPKFSFLSSQVIIEGTDLEGRQVYWIFTVEPE